MSERAASTLQRVVRVDNGPDHYHSGGEYERNNGRSTEGEIVRFSFKLNSTISSILRSIPPPFFNFDNRLNDEGYWINERE